MRTPYEDSKDGGHANKVFYTVLITLMIPSAVTFVPSYVLVSSLGWVSSFIAAAISILPLVLVFLFLQRYLVQGVAETGIKG